MGFDQLQQRAQPLVLHHGSLVDLPNLIEGPIGEVFALVADGDPAIGIVHHRYPLADRRLRGLRWLQDEQHLVILQGQRLGEGALFLPGELVIELVSW